MRATNVGEENGEEKLISLIQGNPKISLSKIAKELNVTSRVIERIIRKAKNKTCWSR